MEPLVAHSSMGEVVENLYEAEAVMRQRMKGHHVVRGRVRETMKEEVGIAGRVVVVEVAMIVEFVVIAVGMAVDTVVDTVVEAVVVLVEEGEKRMLLIPSMVRMEDLLKQKVFVEGRL